MKRVDLTDLVELMAYMRGPKGCPWDREQKLNDFLMHLKNESDEALKAIRKEDYENLREELGDVLWNIVFICQIAREQKKFDIYDVMHDVREKIIRRHPHVFGNAVATTPEEVMVTYQKAKKKEKKLLSDSNKQKNRK
jgi:uncharacterized protein YabN with tetrapyrrole methylase and pyrophosphatase domain